jgi:hypothetical protein
MANIVTPQGRLSYPHLLKPNDGGNFPSGKYETGFIIDKSEDISHLQKEVDRILKEEFPKLKSVSQLKHQPIKDGDADGKYPGSWFIKAKSTRKPKVVDYDPKHAMEDEDEIYGGQNAKISINFFAYDAKGTKGIGVGLGNVQILRGGERFGGTGSSNPADEFTNEYDSSTGFEDGDNL